MKVISPAGEFEIKVSEANVEGKHIVIKGQMGVWDSKIYITPGDLYQFVSIIARPRVMLFLLMVPFRAIYYMFATHGANETEEDDES